MSKIKIIAEIGINHNGSLENAKKLIDVAKIAGCDYVKFQKRNPDICVPEHQKNKLRDTPWGTMKYIDYKKRIEFNKKDFDQIDDYCKKSGILWTTSVWDIDSLNFSMQYDLKCIKIASALITDLKLLEETSKKYNEIILSSGMSTIEEIDTAVNIALKHSKKVILMHCNSAYPAPLNELNLKCIQTLKEKYKNKNVIIGYSGHETYLHTSLAALSLGAEYIERHITLDRQMWGTDQFCSLEPQGLFRLVQATRQLEIAFGDGKIGVTPSELPSRKKLRGV
jgi:N-acetylneuraminate synthase